MLGLRTEELVLILLVLILLFGGKKIPEISRGIGQSLKEFRKGLYGPLVEKDEKEKNDKKKKSIT